MEERKMVYAKSPAPPEKIQGPERVEEGIIYDKSPAPFVQNPQERRNVGSDTESLVPEPKKEVPLDGKEAGMVYKSGNFTADDELGDVPLMVPREPIYGSEDGADDITLGRLPELLKQRFTHASDRGGVSDFVSSLSYHEKLLDENPLVFNPAATNIARALIAEGRALRSNEEKKAFMEKANKFFDSMSVERRK